MEGQRESSSTKERDLEDQNEGNVTIYQFITSGYIFAKLLITNNNKAEN